CDPLRMTMDPRESRSGHRTVRRLAEEAQRDIRERRGEQPRARERMQAPASIWVLLAREIASDASAPCGFVGASHDRTGDHHLRGDHCAPHDLAFPGSVPMLTRSESAERALGRSFRLLGLEMRL